jgi:hypothetical protein
MGKMIFYSAPISLPSYKTPSTPSGKLHPKPGRGIKGIVKDRILSFGMVLGIGFLLLVSLILSTVLAAVGNYLGGMMPGLQFLWSILNFLLSFGVISLLFALMFKFLPDVKITWGDVGDWCCHYCPIFYNWQVSN